MNEIEKNNENCKQRTEEEGTTSIPFDISNLRLSQNFSEDLGLKRVVTSIPVRKPGKQDFVRVHPSDGYRLETAVLEIALDKETFLIDPKLWPQLSGEIVPKVLFTTINRMGELSLWPIRLPDVTGKIDNWNNSALVAANMAMEKWVRVSSNRSLGAYEVYEAEGNFPEPEFPDISFKKIIDIAFRGKFIGDINHPILKKLRGEI